MQLVTRRDEATLLPLIQQFVRPGSTVYSDAWAAYKNLGQHAYAHGVVVHQENFVDPMTCVDTQNIEAYWSKAKHKKVCLWQQITSYPILFGRVHVEEETGAAESTINTISLLVFFCYNFF